MPCLQHSKGALSHSAGTAPIITVFIPGTPLHTPPPYRGVHDPFKTASGVQRGLGPVATGDGKQPTSRTARAQRTVRPPTL